jgi:outer membrane protein TolC
MFRLVIPLLLVATTAGGAAAVSPPARLALEPLIDDARLHNPMLQAARARARAAAAVPDRVRGWDDPTFSYEGWNVPESLRFDRADNTILRLSQKIPFPGKRTLTGTVAARDAEVVEHEADEVELDVVASVKAAYYDLWRAHQDLGVYQREKALVDRLAGVATERYAAGAVSQADVLRAQVELTRLVNRVTTQTLALEGARAELNALLSRAPDAPLGVPEDPPPPRLDATAAALTALAFDRRPELAAQTAAIAREEAGVQLARRGLYPDFEVAGSRFINFGRDDGFGAYASITVPLAFKAKYDAGVAEASARVVSAEAERRRTEDRIRREVLQAFVRARAALLQNDLFVTTHIPQAEQALRVTEAGYRSGSVDFPSLIDTARAVEEAHLEHYEAAAQFEKARAELERVVGAPLPAAAPHPEGGSR